MYLDEVINLRFRRVHYDVFCGKCSTNKSKLVVAKLSLLVHHSLVNFANNQLDEVSIRLGLA